MRAKWGLISIGLVLVFCLSFLNSPVSAQSLRFDPDPYIPIHEQFAVPLVLESGGMDIKGIEAIITFDSALVALDSITAGPWYTAAGQDYFFWDYTTPSVNTVHFASAMLDGVNNADGTIAFCHFSVLDFGVCPLQFTLADVRDVNNAELTFSVDSGVILLNPAVDTDKLKFANLKAIYR